MNLNFNFRKSIRSKLLLSFIILCTISSLIVNLITYNNVLKETKRSFIKSTQKEINQVDFGVSNYISTMKETCDLLRNDIDIKNIDSRITSYVDKTSNSGFIEMTPLKNDPFESRLYTYFKNIVNSHSLVDAVTLAVSENGGFLRYPTIKRSNRYDPRTRDWYKNVIAEPNKIHLSDVHATSTGDLIISALVAIKNSNDIKGVLSLDFNPKQISNIVEKIKLGSNGFVILTDKHGNILANPNDKSTIFKNIKDLNIKGLTDISNRSPLELSTKLSNGKTYLVNIHPSSNKDLGWTYISFIDKNELSNAANRLGIINFIIFILCMILSSIVAFFISNRISRPINVISNHLNTISKGDLTLKLDKKYIELEDEIGQIAKITNSMENFLNSILINLKNHSVNIEDNSLILYSSIKQISSSSKEISSAVQDTTKGTCNLAENISTIARNFNNFSNELKQVVFDISEIDKNTKDINLTASSSNSNLRTLNKSMLDISNSFNSFSSRILELSDNVKQINNIINLIDTVAEQTNLLALNAAIEASRAGESGKSFAVVAEEIRKLSEQSKNSAKDINTILNNISNSTDIIVNDTNTINNEFKTQADIINKSITAFKNIIHMVESVSSKLELLNSSTLNIEKDRNTILESIEEISGVSEEISASSQEISASSENMNESIDGILKISDNLNNITKSMMIDVNTMKTDDSFK
ncbi:methyl-accepting chemotaxis protein [Clostridium botulinum C]|uniref:methyl-accepting chemotaxis protein n=1 Tax=Clostridium botulinum TaxID=1491 RepID=UPI001E47D024|nr:methyl-accepting chemotaxis protein [Clostridium botulinum]MCD3244891.1 methyl-accepting chemotaxis protein [Clostridium botulinum C]MCD3261549.1 methyl-accepting chemotaxis protein [Clostridium botulinum C]